MRAAPLQILVGGWTMVAFARRGDRWWLAAGTGGADARHLLNRPGYRAGNHRRHKLVQGVAAPVIQRVCERGDTESQRSPGMPVLLSPRQPTSQRTAPGHHP